MYIITRDSIPRNLRRCIAGYEALLRASKQSSITRRSFSERKATGPERRRRFYVHVDVVSCPPVWEERNKLHKDNKSMQESPISAGVDNTDSASGVARGVDKQQQSHTLQLRVPGSHEPLKNQLNWFTIRLDERPLKTPLGHPLAVPSETLAYALAAEWNCQVVDVINPTQMPLMTLVATSIDQTAQATDFYQNNILRYLRTDTVCYWADPMEERSIHRRQQSAWKDVHAWITEWSGGYAPGVAMGHAESMLMAKQKQLPHPPQLQQACHNLVHSLDAWHLTALHAMTIETKSMLLAIFLLLSKSGSIKDVAAAMEAARVEEEFNISNWGLVEGQHDYDRLNASIQLHAAMLLKDCLAADNFSS
ncbi:ATP synthase mitochondrial F1 complex assembly factor 2 [Fistulifera solaris]|uniref:ATP synthase mitochondrial F1 complex assembly factor 2 n=1 Tax=Fistulifera solaris TaxID=1519565 RepID=A0A1Z5K2A6_FISSO|nr:ATP synthase mitochondrial F1 complex assembly factor 2 [Fistulifera solaris]|eukprot:GAX20148.1 ATP synthase mitochondrial F1 complex assembly factor 2 [Fistulifera solaris]